MAVSNGVEESIYRLETRHKSPKLPTAFVLFWLFVAVHGNATEVAVIVTRDWAAFATDSLFLANGVVPIQGCKINQLPNHNVFWAAAGIPSDPLTGFDIAAFFARAKEQPVGKILDTLAPNLVSALEKEIPIIKRLEPSIYADMMRGGFILTLAVVGIERGHPATYWKDFAVIGDSVVAKPAVTCKPSSAQKHCIIVNIPESMQYAARNPEIWESSTIDVIDRLMTIGQTARPQAIGPPFSVILIRQQGSEWLRQNDCLNVQTTKRSTFNKRHGF